MDKCLKIKSHKGFYAVNFGELFKLDEVCPDISKTHCIIDENLIKLYPNEFSNESDWKSFIRIESVEYSKSINNIIPVIENLVKNGVRRDDKILAIGGGVIQDISCFISSIILRGVNWSYIPTTLLSQADSCIGSKSSINVDGNKNILGTFYPPENVYIFDNFLETLSMMDIKSGTGEIIKVHAISGFKHFNKMAADYDLVISNKSVLSNYIKSALNIKKKYIEQDEFDTGSRLIFNYGHSFGHAIESASNFSIPHGIAVSMGMDIANQVAVAFKMLPKFHADRMHPVLRKNYENSIGIKLDLDNIFDALSKDKKNSSNKLRLVAPVGENAEIKLVEIAPDNYFKKILENSLNTINE